MTATDRRNITQGLTRVEAGTFAISAHEMQHLLGDESPYKHDSYLAGRAISKALRGKDIDVNGVAGGINFYVTSDKAEAAAEVLRTFGIELGALSTETFNQSVDRSPQGLEGLAVVGFARDVTQGLAKVEAGTFAISAHEMQHLLGDESPYKHDSYLAGRAISKALRGKDIDVNGVAGGINFYVTSDKAEAAAEVLRTFGIELGALSTETFNQSVDRSPQGLEGLAAAGDARALQILEKLKKA